MAEEQDFDKTKHPMATIEGKGNRFVRKGDSQSQESDKDKGRYESVDYFTGEPKGETEESFFKRGTSDQPQAIGFANKERKNTKHHARHAREMGYKNQDEYERAGVEFFNSNRGKLYYSEKRKRFYRYDEKSGKLAVVSEDGTLHTYMKKSPRNFKDFIKEEKLYE